jgi:glycosyltransferase involved in cell wall biosynthesis
MDRIGFPGEVVDGVLPGYTRPIFRIKGNPLISLIIPTAGKTAVVNGQNLHLLENFVQSIYEISTWKNMQLVVLENGNLSEETMKKLSSRNALIVPYREEKFNLARKVNLGVQNAAGEYVVILNDDMQVISPDWIEQLLQFQQQDGVGVVGAKLLFADRTIQHAGVTIIGGNPGHPYYKAPEDTIGHGGICTTVANTVAVTGACSMTPRNVFLKAGGYDAALDSNYNDIDYCLRLIEAGYRIVMKPFAVLWHYESLSKEHAGIVNTAELDLFHSRWRDKYQREAFMRCV